MRKRRIISILVCTLVILSSVLIIPDDLKVEASGGGGGEGGDGGIGLDYDFMWNVTKNLSNVVYKAYEGDKIPKGREFGTKGDNYTADLINEHMMDNCSLENVKKLKLGPIAICPDRYYTSKIDVTDYLLHIDLQDYNNDTGLPNSIPVNESFVVPPHIPETIGGGLTFNYTLEDEDDIRLSTVIDYLGGSLTNCYLNLSMTPANKYDLIIGNATYIASNDSLPQDQDTRVFIFDEEDGCEEKLDNVTNTSAVILIYNNDRDYNADAANYSFSVGRVNSNDGNLTEILEKLENETMFVDNVLCDETLTFTYNLSCCSNWPNNFVSLCELVHPRTENTKKPDYGGWVIISVVIRLVLNRILKTLFNVECKGIILYDSYNETHYMNCGSAGKQLGGWFRSWENSSPCIGAPGLPIFTVNNSVGTWLYNHANQSNNTITGYVNQTYLEETHDGPYQDWEAGVDAYNVIGNITIDHSPGDSIVLISNRFDGCWTETPFDSGCGAGVVLAIAKYFDDYNITPKVNITFLETTGEEYLFRGAQHYSDSNPNLNFSYWIGFDQLACNWNGTPLNLTYNDHNVENITKAIANQMGYPKRTDNNYTIDHEYTLKFTGAEEDVWKQRNLSIDENGIDCDHKCKTICFVKDSYHRLNPFRHRRGMNFTEGDVLKNIDRADLNDSLELAWNITKYFTVNPDCWFDSYSEIKLDSAGDGDYLNDSIKATFTVKSILPHDLVMINATLKNAANDTVNQTFMNFTVNSTGRQESVTLTIPENEPPGNYTLYLELYNSTGRINEIVEIGDNNYNDTTPSPSYFIDMYPYNFDKFPSEITNVSATPSPVGFGFSVTISADVTDNASYVNNVSVNITYPNNNTGNFTMTNTEGDTYEYVFSDTWLVGQYNYTIWTLDNSSNSNSSSGHSFNVSAQANISVCTIKDEYGNNETVNLTDPPGVDPPLIGYELLDDGDVLHMWNEYNSYYFNTSSGIQLTNYYGEYWSHNVMMLGYYNNDEWNLIYRTDELSGFNKNIGSDNETHVNATLWKDLTYGGYDFRLAVRYHLGADDSDLTVIPYIKNLGQAIPYTLGFGWEIKDIKIADTYENDRIRLYNGTDWISYRLNQTLDNKYTDMDYNTTFYLEGLNEGKHFRRTLYLRWNHTLDYLLWVKSRTGQYNAPVTLFIKVGTLAQNQEKYTMMNWLDSDAWLGVSGWNYHSSCGHTWPDNPWGALNGTGIWAHMTTENHWLVIDLNETYNIKKIRGRSNTPDDPTSVDIYISDDPSSWGPAVETGITTWQDTDNWAEVNITDTVGRYINISITSTEGMAGDDYLEFGKLPTPMTIFDVYGEEVSTATYYFSSYDNNKAWATNPSYMVDGSTSTYAATSANGEIELCDGNTCSGTNLGIILKVELRVYGYYSGAQRDIILRPVFGGSPGSDYTYQTTSTAGWSQWFNITDDNSAPGNWDWTDVSNLDCEVQGESSMGAFTLYCSKVEMRVIYDPVPGFSDPYPANGSIGISISPTLNITVSDADGDLMNLTWYSNSSGSWQVFGTNNSVGNGTYRQTFSNATENGKWWYWKVNVSDGTSYNESSVYKFYTGYQSKIKNTGSTSIKGYLLIQVQCYNTSSVTWAVADDTINEVSPRTIYSEVPDSQDLHVLALDTIFNGLVNTSNLSSYGNGTYRIYAAFRDPEGNILVTDDETELVATYEFDITFG